MTITITHAPPTTPSPQHLLEATMAHLVKDGTKDPVRISRGQQLPNPTRLVCAITNAAIEAFQGVRPVHQLLSWVSPEVYEMLSARAQVHASRATSPAPHGALQQTVRVLRTRVMRVSAIAAEATVVIHDGTRVRAAALRVEEHRGRWQVTALEIG